MNAHAASGRRWKPAPLDEARSHGAEATGLSRVTIRAGVQDLVLPGIAPGPRARAVSRPGGGRKFSECGSRISCMPWTPWSTRSALDGPATRPVERSRRSSWGTYHQAGEVPWRVELHHPNEDIKG